jgi:alpha-glucosidase
LLLAFAIALSSAASAKPIRISSPDGKVEAIFFAGSQLQYRVDFRGETVVHPSALGINVNGNDLGQHTAMTGKVQFRTVKEEYVARGANRRGLNHYHAMTIPFAGGETRVPWFLEVRAYNDGVAYRYRVPGEGQRRILGERSEWILPTGTTIWHQSAENRSYEARYYPDIVGQMGTSHRLMAPAAVKFRGGLGYGLITEANLVNYSDMALYSSGPNGFRAVFHDDPQGWEHVGEIVSPWRVTLLSRDLNGMVNSHLIQNLCPAPAPELASAEWIMPGRSIWHWLTGGAPKLEEQREWIDGTSQIGYEYYLVDDGWRDWDGGGENAWNALAGVVNYAAEKGVRIWLWVDSKYVFKPNERLQYMERAKDLGIVGLKVDFPKPANSVWVQWYEDVLRDAAQMKLMIDFHGCVKPTGRERTWPHEMTREAVAGREQGKSPASHDNTLPFLRYVQGHADFTPTLFLEKRLNGSSFAHELAMPIVFTSPYLCLGDHPKRYLESVAVDVLRALPPVWDETLVLPISEIGELSAFARRSGQQWFIGVIGDGKPRRETIRLDFLGKGTYKLVALADDPERNDTFLRRELRVTRKDHLVLPLRKDGGYVGWLVPLKEN